MCSAAVPSRKMASAREVDLARNTKPIHSKKMKGMEKRLRKMAPPISEIRSLLECRTVCQALETPYKSPATPKLQKNSQTLITSPSASLPLPKESKYAPITTKESAIGKLR